LKRRLDLRSNGEFQDFGVTKKINDDLLKIKYATEYQIDTTGLLPEHTAEAIYAHLIEK
jgi:hypothetical protein